MFTDEELIVKYRQGDLSCMDNLISRYRAYVRAKARSYFLIGGEQEDLVQEGMIGLFKAIRDYQPDRNSLFKSFAVMCINRQLATALKLSTRYKHLPLNSYVSFYQDLGGGTEIKDTLEANGLSPEDIVIDRDILARIAGSIDKKLSPLEKKVLSRYIQGISYRQISQELSCDVKAIDNALQRIKKKLNADNKDKAE